jgi:hypothetical protein
VVNKFNVTQYMRHYLVRSWTAMMKTYSWLKFAHLADIRRVSANVRRVHIRRVSANVRRVHVRRVSLVWRVEIVTCHFRHPWCQKIQLRRVRLGRDSRHNTYT